MWNRIRALVWKELLQLRRDKLTLVMILFIPLFQITIYGFLNNDVKHLHTIVLDESRSQESRDFVQAMSATQYFDVLGEVSSEAQIRELIDKGKAEVAIWFPTDYARQIRSGGTGQALVIVDASNATVAGSAMSVAFGVGQTRSTQIMFDRMGYGQATKPQVPIDLRIRPWYNPNLRTPNFIIPGLVAIIVSMTCVMFAAASIVKEKERGTLDQVMVTPVRPLELFLGKVIPIIGMAYTQMTVLLVLARVVFQVPIAGSILLLYASAFLFIVAMLGVGVRISTVAQSQAQASQMSFMMFLPMVFLSDYIFPIHGMPVPFQIISELIPVTHFIRIMRAIVMRGVGIDVIWVHAAKLLLFIAFIWTIAVKGMRRASA
ncbi:MAG TPA: ABC transporter permease [Holophagaceae bacterium]|nr:ABC transporter permease [Holophagaceae bacterium]